MFYLIKNQENKSYVVLNLDKNFNMWQIMFTLKKID